MSERTFPTPEMIDAAMRIELTPGVYLFDVLGSPARDDHDLWRLVGVDSTERIPRGAEASAWLRFVFKRVYEEMMRAA
jgi:hypothetical protein